MLVVRSRLALRLVLPLAAVVAAAVVVVLLVSGGSGGVRVDTAAAKPIVDPQGTPAKVPAKPYVVLIVMDEFPGDALLDAHGQIDPVRYPNIAALAANGTWYRNAWSMYDSTTKAVPLILDGLRPRPGTGPNYVDHPHSIFELLGRRGYRIETSQEAESMCAPRWCPGASAEPPAIVPNLQRGRPQRFERFIRSIRPGRPTFWFKHALLPHKPYLYLPSGHTTRPVGTSDPMRRHGHRARLLRRVRHAPQRAALPAPARLHRPPARQAVRASEEPRACSTRRWSRSPPTTASPGRSACRRAAASTTTTSRRSRRCR